VFFTKKSTDKKYCDIKGENPNNEPTVHIAYSVNLCRNDTLSNNLAALIDQNLTTKVLITITQEDC